MPNSLAAAVRFPPVCFNAISIVYLSLSYTHKQDGHVKVTFLEEKFSKRIRNITKCMTNILAACLFFLISILNFQEGLEYIEQNIRSSGVLGYPLAPALFIISLGMMMITLRLLNEVTRILSIVEIGAGAGMTQLVQFFGGAFGVTLAGLMLTFQKGLLLELVYRNIFLSISFLIFCAMIMFYFYYRKVKFERIV